MKKTLLAGLISKKNKYEIKKIDVPKMFEGSALVKVKVCGICGTCLLYTSDAADE